MTLMIFCMDHIWRDAFFRALMTILPVILFTAIALPPLYILTEMRLEEVRKKSATPFEAP